MVIFFKCNYKKYLEKYMWLHLLSNRFIKQAELPAEATPCY